MPNNLLEQFEELYSQWSVSTNINKGMRLAQLWQQVSGVYNYLHQIYLMRGYLTPEEANSANQLQQILLWLQTQKAQVDHNLADEMMKHLVKMNMKKNIISSLAV